MAKQEIEMHGLEEDQVDEASIITKDGPKALRPRSLRKHEVIKDHGTHNHESGKEHRVFSVKRPNGFHGVLVTDKDKTHVIGQTAGNHTKEDALKIADHYKKHGQVGMQRSSWYIGGDAIVKESEEIDEMDFGSIGKTLSKYGKGVPKEEPKKPTRSTVHTDYTMTGHQEKKSSTGRVYTKAPEMDREPEAIKATVKADQVEAPKRGRGRPAGATNKAGTGKGWSAEAKASMKAKLAARKAAKLAAKNESVELTEEDWANITECQSLDSIVEFMMEEEYQSLDELSKKTLGSYVKKATAVADNSRKYAKIGDPDDADFAIQHRAYAAKKEAGIAKASKRLTKESEDLDEAVTISHDRFERSHGTKAKDNGPARWMFTSKRMGDVNHKDEKEFHEAPHGSFADAKKSAKAWAKKHGHDTAYVMESVEITESTEDLNIQRYAALIGKNLIKE